MAIWLIEELEESDRLAIIDYLLTGEADERITMLVDAAGVAAMRTLASFIGVSTTNT